MAAKDAGSAIALTAFSQFNLGEGVEKKETDFAVKVAKEISGDNNVEDDAKPDMGAEDFSYMLHERPGAFLNLGQGKGPGVHNTKFDFNDDLSPIGASFFVKLVEKASPI